MAAQPAAGAGRLLILRGCGPGVLSGLAGGSPCATTAQLCADGANGQHQIGEQVPGDDQQQRRVEDVDPIAAGRVEQRTGQQGHQQRHGGEPAAPLQAVQQVAQGGLAGNEPFTGQPGAFDDEGAALGLGAGLAQRLLAGVKAVFVGPGGRSRLALDGADQQHLLCVVFSH